MILVKKMKQHVWALFSIGILLGTMMGLTVNVMALGPVVLNGVGGLSWTGDATISGYLQVNGTISGSNLTSGTTTQTLPWTNITATTQQPYSYLIGVFSNSSYYAVNGTDGQYVNSWTSTNASYVFQSTVNAMTQGGKIYCKGIFYNMTTVSLPYGRNYYFYGEGMPAVYSYPIALAQTMTPTDGTQFRGDVSLLTKGGNTAIFQRVSNGSYRQGTLAFFDCAIMPAWGTTVGTTVFGILDQGSAILIEDNLLFTCWGWAEANFERPCWNTMNDMQSQFCTGNGGGTEARIGHIVEMGMNYGSQVTQYDNVNVLESEIWLCPNGVQFNGIWQSNIMDLAIFDPINFGVKYAGSGPIWAANIIQTLTVESINWSPEVTYIAELSGANDTLSIFRTVIWSGPAQATYTNLTSADVRLVGSNLVFNLEGVRSWQTITGLG